MSNSLLAHLTATLGLALTVPAIAAEYYIVVPFPSKKAPSMDISLTLSSATLPAAMVGKAYSYSLRNHLLVTGDKALDLSQATLTTPDALPAGLSLAANGTLSGTPTVKNEAGTSFQVTASYKTKVGQQAYSIVVNGAVLQVIQVSAGEDHTCAVTTTGGVKCWGWDNYGQLGDGGSATNQAAPVDVVGLTSGFARVAAGAGHTCAISVAGGLKCWGRNSYGQLGDGGATNQSTPVDVVGLASGVSSVALGGEHTCAVTTTGGLKCWGLDNYGQLGDVSYTFGQQTPSDVSGLTSGVASVSAGIYHTCAVTTYGGVKCWGSDNYGQIGDGGLAMGSSTPVDVVGLTAGIASLAAGRQHTCAVTTAGGLKCWGLNNYTQLGNGLPATDQQAPVDVTGMASGVALVSAGNYHTCVLTTAGGLKCWGSDTYGQLGDGAPATYQAVPSSPVGLTSGVASVSTGGSHTCAVTTSGSLKCWGSDSYGQLGNGLPMTNQSTPADVAP